MPEMKPGIHPDYDPASFRAGWERQDASGHTSCGPGSLPSNTVGIQETLTRIVTDFDIAHINDVGCGDLNWMGHWLVGMRAQRQLRYVGYDLHDWQPSWNERRAQGYDLRAQDCARVTPEAADMTIMRDVGLHVPNEILQVLLKNCFESSPLVFTTTFITGQTPHEFSNDAEERAERFRTQRRNLNHAMFDLSENPFNLRAMLDYSATENYQGKVMCLYRREDQNSGV